MQSFEARLRVLGDKEFRVQGLGLSLRVVLSCLMRVCEDASFPCVQNFFAWVILSGFSTQGVGT